jgi:hypothetical protein
LSNAALPYSILSLLSLLRTFVWCPVARHYTIKLE